MRTYLQQPAVRWAVRSSEVALAYAGAIHGVEGAANLFTFLTIAGTVWGLAAIVAYRWPLRPPFVQWDGHQQALWLFGLVPDLLAAWAGWWFVAACALFGSFLSLAYDFSGEPKPRDEWTQEAA